MRWRSASTLPSSRSSRRGPRPSIPAWRPSAPDLTADRFDAADVVTRLREPGRAGTAIGEALLDQRVMAGVGNVFRSEILYLERVDPFAPVRHAR